MALIARLAQLLRRESLMGERSSSAIMASEGRSQESAKWYLTFCSLGCLALTGQRQSTWSAGRSEAGDGMRECLCPRPRI